MKNKKYKLDKSWSGRKTKKKLANKYGKGSGKEADLVKDAFAEAIDELSTEGTFGLNKLKESN